MEREAEKDIDCFARASVGHGTDHLRVCVCVCVHSVVRKKR
jgi:hypothetical protein